MICNLANSLWEAGFEYVIGVPCSFLQAQIQQCIQHPFIKYITATQEGEALAIATGIFLSGGKAVVLCQNSGLGNLLDPITSLNLPYKIPFVLIISHRGLENDWAHHRDMGEITLPLLNLLKIKIIKLGSSEMFQICDCLMSNLKNGINSCLIIDHKFSTLPQTVDPRNFLVNKKSIKFHSYGERLDQCKIIQTIVKIFEDNALYVSSTGLCSKILYKVKDSGYNFYMKGAMGCASSLGLGLSLKIKKKVFVFEGDGALLMKLGNLATNAYYGKNNFIHIVFENDVYGTTGGQAINAIDFCLCAKAAGYKNVHLIHNNNFKRILFSLNKEHGPHFLLIPTLFKVENFKYPWERDYNVMSLDKIKARFMETIENHAGTL